MGALDLVVLGAGPAGPGGRSLRRLGPSARDKDVMVVGGGNSAGKAAAHLARRARGVRIVVRGQALKSTMSHYLVDRVERPATDRGMTETEITAVEGTATVESVTLRDSRADSTQRVDCTAAT